MDQVATVIDVGTRRAERDRARERARSDHPALRWVAGTAFYVAHRKAEGGAACGAAGALVLAPPGVPLCVACYPPDARSETA